MQTIPRYIWLAGALLALGALEAYATRSAGDTDVDALAVDRAMDNMGGTNLRISRTNVREMLREDDRRQRSMKRMMMRSTVLVVDTRNQETCRQIQHDIESSGIAPASGRADDICRHDADRPISTVLVTRAASEEEFRREIDISEDVNHVLGSKVIQSARAEYVVGRMPNFGPGGGGISGAWSNYAGARVRLDF